MLVLLCAVLSASCSQDDPGSETLGNTEIDLVIDDPNTPPEELLLLIDFVSYRITCPASGLTPHDDSVDLNGYMEVDASAEVPVWEVVTDLPLSPPDDPATPEEEACSISLWVFYEDEVICQGSEVLPIVEDSSPLAPNKVSIVLQCSLSVNGPSANLDVDGSFEFINGNYCPKLNWVGAMPVVVEATVPPETTIETSGFDVDSTCGQNCDPQLCDFTQSPPMCFGAPDPGFSTTFIAPAGKGSFDQPVLTGTALIDTDGTPLGTPIEGSTTYTCDPLYPGPTEICVVASDGDDDCDQMRCITIECPDLCAGVTCVDDGDECTKEYCDRLTGQCITDVAPNGLACADCSATCSGGTCSGPDWVGAVSGTNLVFSGTFQNVSTTLVNPYSGSSLALNGQFRVNNTSYEGVSANDFLFGTNIGDFLLAQEPVGVQRICGVENILSQNSFDAIIVADEFIVMGDMTIEGGNENDVIWANVGDDIIRGNNGIDLLDGGPGDDVIEGGLGNDTVTLWPGSGFDSIDGGIGQADTVEIAAIASQISIGLATAPYEFTIFYLDNPMAQIVEVELLDLEDASIDLTTCTGSLPDICNLCGNDALNGGEECDDGNNVSGDGCAADCMAEY